MKLCLANSWLAAWQHNNNKSFRFCSSHILFTCECVYNDRIGMLNSCICVRACFFISYFVGVFFFFCRIHSALSISNIWNSVWFRYYSAFILNIFPLDKILFFCWSTCGFTICYCVARTFLLSYSARKRERTGFIWRRYSFRSTWMVHYRMEWMVCVCMHQLTLSALPHCDIAGDECAWQLNVSNNFVFCSLYSLHILSIRVVAVWCIRHGQVFGQPRASRNRQGFLYE